jgi:two-component system, sensor histidine kinase and response regulator
MMTEKSQRKILVVDDQEENIYLLRVLLKSQDYEVLEAKTGEEALELLHSEGGCDLILLDVMMPGMDGYEVCRQIREDEKLSRIPVILLTAKRDVESKVRGLDLGANDYVTKPFDRREILARIRSLLTIEDLKKKLVAAERIGAIGEMVVTLNHEINNPLAAIAGNAELLGMMLKESSDEVKEKLKVIQTQSMRIKEILTKVRQLKQISSKTYVKETQMIDLNSDPDEMPAEIE